MSGPNSNFPAFLYANWTNTPYVFLQPPVSLPVHHHHQLRHYHQPSQQTMSSDPQHNGGECASPRAFVIDNNVNIGEGAGSSLATGMPPVSSFEDIFRADTYPMSQWREYNTNQPEMAYRSADQARADLLMPHDTFTSSHDSPYSSFDQRSSFTSSTLSSALSSVGSITDMQPMKIDASPRALPDRAVDVSQFDTISDDVWPYQVRDMPSLDEEYSSPSSTETYSNGPFTPSSPGAEDDDFPGFAGTNFHHAQIPKVDSDGLGNVTMPGSHLQPFLPSMMPRSSQSEQPLSTWPTVSVPQYATAAFPDLFSYPERLLPSTALHTDRKSSMPETGSLQEVEGKVRPVVDTSDESDDEFESSPDVNDLAIHEATHRRERDRYLLSKRREGYSYRDIKKMGKFREAESTLRGRVRVLTKDKSERVRRPTWTQNDVDILRRALDHYRQFEPESAAKKRNADLRGRVPWKKISEWMKRRGSSYLFAPATCAKKWKEVNSKKQ